MSTIRIYPTSGTSTTADMTFSGTSVSSSSVYFGPTTTGDSAWVIADNTFTTYPPDPYYNIRPLVSQWFAGKGISLFPEEETLICFYSIQFRKGEWEKECEEWFPEMARRRVLGV